MQKVTVNGQVMWEESNGERVKDPDDKPKDLYGWKKIHVGGLVMWESPDGERLTGG